MFTDSYSEEIIKKLAKLKKKIQFIIPKFAKRWIQS